MAVLENSSRRLRKRKRAAFELRVPQTRPSILDKDLASEPWIDKCPCTDTLVLFVQNRPVAVIAASSLDCISLATRLHQLRTHAPRQ